MHDPAPQLNRQGEASAAVEDAGPGAHRPYPAPASRWAMFMRWERLAFLHWRVDPAALRPHLPAGLEIETFDGSAWLGVVPFTMDGVRARLGPRLPRVSRFCELNVRTYVAHDGEPGVWFFSLDAHSRLAVETARAVFGLNYLRASMSSVVEPGSGEDGSPGVRYMSKRVDRRGKPAELRCRFGPAGPVFASEPGSLEDFLTSRYRLFTAGTAGNRPIRRGEIDHAPWPLQPAWCQIETNTMGKPLGLDLEGEPLAHYVDTLDVVAWLPKA